MEESSSTPARRKVLRWIGFDYCTTGVYFVTICTAKRRPLLGHVDDTGRLLPSRVGWSVDETWHGLPDRFLNVELIAFIAMPDHVHGLLAIAPGVDAAQPPLALGRIVSVFKSMSTHQTRALRDSGGQFGPFWQQGFHDRVVRSNHELRQIEWYIKENPARWASSRMPSGEADSEYRLA